ncbi:hypothetical protein IKG50_01285 [Candidatus Saccharibacteria bacterium]|nr:hypothetical protein [Candidatus Saccharibacteria bacterium]
MKRLKGEKKHLSNKKRLILSVSAVFVFALIGITLAVSRDFTYFGNLFGLFKDDYEFTENVGVKRTEWQPCEEKDKSIIATNTAGSKKWVAIKFDESWKTANDNDLPLTKDGVRLVSINMADDWQEYWELQDDGYYHYKTQIDVGESTEPLIKSITLSCDADFGAENVCVQTATGQECTKPNDEWEDSSYHLIITGFISDQPKGEAPHVIDCEGNNLYDTVACQAPEQQPEIDFRRGAIVSDSAYDKNGNGVNKGDEFQKDIYYYRGQIDNNYLVWANKCWRIVRTTATGGTKILYIGEPDGNGACPTEPVTMIDDMYSYGAMWEEDPTDNLDDFGLFTWTILGASYDCNEDHAGFFGWTGADCYNSLADVGYMIGERKPVYYDAIERKIPNGAPVTTANNIAYINGQYVLDPNTTTTGDYYNDDAYFDLVLGGSHYSCFSTATTCETAYMIIDNYYNGGAIYIELHNGELLEDYLNTVFSNQTASPAKTAVEDWYHKELLAYDSDLEDAVFCNDRTLHSGTLASKDEGPISAGRYTYSAYFDAYARNTIDINGNFHPNLACSKNDAFTVSNAIGNGKNVHKVGLLSNDELTFAGINANGDQGTTNFLYYDGRSSYTMSPAYYASQYTDFMPYMGSQGAGLGAASGFQSGWGAPGIALRPVVSLKQTKNITSGDGTRTNPYHVD